MDDEKYLDSDDYVNNFEYDNDGDAGNDEPEGSDYRNVEEMRSLSVVSREMEGERNSQVITNDSDSLRKSSSIETVFPEAIAMTDIPQNRSRDVLVDAGNEECDKPARSLFFSDRPLRVDYVLTYKANDDNEAADGLRLQFENNLGTTGVVLERDHSSDGEVGCVKIHCPWEVLAKGAKLLKMRKRIKISKELEPQLDDLGCFRACAPLQDIAPDEEDYFTALFDPSKPEKFVIGNKDDFFTNAERSLITKMFLDQTEYMKTESDEKQKINRGIVSLLSHNVYTAAFPLHEGNIRPHSGQQGFFDGLDKDRLRLYHGWAKPSNFFRFQPLDLIRKYFGEKIGLFFAWMGFYTVMLIPASAFGMGVFLYGLGTIADDQPTKDICNSTYLICPLCDRQCDYSMLNGSCIYARLTHVFDNYATVALAVFMSVWALMFLEFWKREQAALQFKWDTCDYETDEMIRPGYTKNATKFKVNPITQKEEPYVPWYSKLGRLFTSLSLVAFLICVLVIAIFAVIVYRFAVSVGLYTATKSAGNAKLITTVTAAVINLVIITILSAVYKKIAAFTTKKKKVPTATLR